MWTYTFVHSVIVYIGSRASYQNSEQTHGSASANGIVAWKKNGVYKQSLKGLQSSFLRWLSNLFLAPWTITRIGKHANVSDNVCTLCHDMAATTAPSYLHLLFLRFSINFLPFSPSSLPPPPLRLPYKRNQYQRLAPRSDGCWMCCSLYQLVSKTIFEGHRESG